MVRTRPALVKGVLQDKYQDGVDLSRYIAAANIVLNNYITYAAQRGYVATSDQLREMETWVAAWFYTQQDPLYQARSELGASGSFQDHSFKVGAVAMDPTGVLSALLSGKYAGMSWLGKYPSSQTPYEDKQ